MLWHHIAHDFDATRQFIAVQVHPGNWFGNIVAGVVVYATVDVCWRTFAKRIAERWLARIHARSLAKHHEEVVKPLLVAQHEAKMDQAEEHHEEALKLAREHHEAHMAALKARRRPPTKKAPGAKKAPKRPVAAKMAAPRGKGAKP